MKKLSAIIIVILVVLTTGVHAQDQSRPQLRGEGHWLEMVSIKFIAGKKPEAKEIIKNYFIPADKKINRAVIGFEPLMSTWDMIIYIPLKQGLEEYNYTISQSDMEWFAAVAEVAGSTEAAEKIWAQYMACVENHERQIVWQGK